MHVDPVIPHLVLTVVVLLLTAAAVLAVTRWVPLPFTVALVLSGLALRQGAARDIDFLALFARVDLSPGVILFVFLPTLIFETAFNMNARQLGRNLWPVLTLAVPGLVISTAVIGLMVWGLTPLALSVTLLLGAILSATDPVAVIALFKQLGAPKRLTILVEGESLFNDATAIVLAGILAGVMAAGGFSTALIGQGIVDFFIVFLGGAVVGAGLAWIFGALLGRVNSNAFIEISMTLGLAYGSFLIAEHLLHVSGVMATLAAGLTMGSWGRTKISPDIARTLDGFWDYMAMVANAMIFLMVGLRIDPGALLAAWPLLAATIVAMLVSRAVVVFGLIPLIGRLPGANPISRAYQAVIYWGGLRGAIALAIVLGLGDIAEIDTLIALVAGAVLFTLLVNALSIGKLVDALGLATPSLGDRLALTEGLLEAKDKARRRIPDLQHGGLFSARVAEQTTARLAGEIAELWAELAALRGQDLSPAQERHLLTRRCLAAEKSHYYDMFTKGHLSEPAFRDLAHSVDLQRDAIRQGLPLPGHTLHPLHERPWSRWRDRILRHLAGVSRLPERIRTAEVARDYEEAWGRYQGSLRVLDQLADLARIDALPAPVVGEIQAYYRTWKSHAKSRIDATADQFPEFALVMQQRVAARLVDLAQSEALRDAARDGAIPSAAAARVLAGLTGDVRRLRGVDKEALAVSPAELLRKVPFFSAVSEAEFERIAARLIAHTIADGSEIICQGEIGDSLYLISRGVLRVSRADGDTSRDLATLMAGDFIGETALLHQVARTASCRAVTPCVLYELRAKDFAELSETHPGIRAAVEAIERKRLADNRRQ